MAKDRIVIPGIPTDAARVIIERLLAQEERLAILERRRGRAGVVTSDTAAKVGELLNIEAPTAGLTIVLPTSTQALRNARVTLSFRNSNPVRIVCVLGTVNGETFVLNDRPGTYDAICDGIGGWAVQVGVSEEGSGAGGGGGALQAAGLQRITRYHTAGAGTHACLSTSTHALVVACGGGGAAGGANAAAGQASVGGGASAGGTVEVLLDLSLDGPDIAYSVGDGGTGVVGTSGGNGTNTTVTYDGVTYTGSGGLGSVASTSGTTFQLIGCVVGGAATNGDVNTPGGAPGIACRETATSGCGGNGGASRFSPGPAGASSAIGASASADGRAGVLGAGGSGAVNFNNSPAAGNTGGNGGTGFVWVFEYAMP